MSKGTYEGKLPTIDDFCNPEPIEQKSYICQNCKKVVYQSNYYGSGRFCSKFCAHSYVGKTIHTEEVKKKVKDKLRVYTEAKRKKKLEELIRIPYKNHFLEPFELISLFLKWNVKDVASILSIPKNRILLFAKQNNIVIPDNYVNSNAFALIKVCRHVLNKQFEDGSITLSDLAQVQRYCIRLMRNENYTPAEICTIFLGMKKEIHHFLHIVFIYHYSH